MDRANCKATGGNNSQGAIYKVPNALGPQFLSTLESAPMTGFGGSQRPSMATKSGFPGPGAYKVKPGVGEPCSQVKFPAPAISHSVASGKLCLGSRLRACNTKHSVSGPAADAKSLCLWLCIQQPLCAASVQHFLRCPVITRCPGIVAACICGPTKSSQACTCS